MRSAYACQLEFSLIRILPQAEQDREVIVQLPQCQGAAA